MKRPFLAASLLFTLTCPGPAQTPANASADVTKDAQRLPGLFTLYRKDEKVWLAIKPDQFDKPFFFTCNIQRGIGERGLDGSKMGECWIVVFHKVGNQVQLIAKNTDYVARAKTPQAHFVAENFSDSLLSSTAVLTGAHPADKAVVIEANALLFVDIPYHLTYLERAYHLPFSLDSKNSSFARVNNTPDLTGLGVRAHYSLSKIPASAGLMGQTLPTTVPDPRSVFFGYYYSFTKLPEQPMKPRLADDRVGHFVTTVEDRTEDLSPDPKTHYVNRWRLEKKDPNAPLSEPRQPIVYWIDKNVPEKYRASVRAGILEWNKAFEPIGFRDAIVVKQQSESDDFDTMDTKHASVRWYTAVDAGSAVGPSHKDPRTGEILDADIRMADVFGLHARRIRAEDVRQPVAHNALTCNYAAEMADEAEFAMDCLEAQGMRMDSPAAEALAQAYVKEVVTHEVGHTLGLRHNFRASMAYTLKQLQDPNFTRAHGMSASVMDYIPFNLALQGEPQGEYLPSTLGPYDYLAIKYAYKPMDPLSESSELARIAAQTTTNPQLAYSTDEDAAGMDPDVNRFDLGADPIEFYKKRIRLTRELWDRMQNLNLESGEGYQRLTRSFNAGMGQLRVLTPLVAKYVGGVRQRRDHAGTGHPTLEPIPAAQQRAALRLITETLFKPASFRVKPELVARLAWNRFERRSNPDVSLTTQVLSIQRTALDAVMSDSAAQRLLDGPDKVAQPDRLLKLSELYDTLQSAIWSELKNGGDIPLLRRNLQREHLKRMTALILRPASSGPADTRSLTRLNGTELAAQLRKSLTRHWSKESKAHIMECLNTLNDALKAGVQRNGL